MISFSEAQKVILDSIFPLSPEKIHFDESMGTVLAEPIFAKENIPFVRNSAVDGFALLAEDTIATGTEPGPTLQIIGEVNAGHVIKKIVTRGTAVKITTGAPVPVGADAVIMREQTEEKDEFVHLLAPVEKGENIREAGEDIQQGEKVFDSGHVIQSADVGILASLGVSIIKGYRKPVVGILATGDELIDVKKKLTPGKVRNSNVFSLAAQVRECGAIPKILGIARDHKKEIEKKVKYGLSCDVIITSAGVSIGEKDYVREVLTGLGFEEKFWRVRIKPGKPLLFGFLKKIPLFGLPGNPVSTMVTFEIFIRPALLKMMGHRDVFRPTLPARLEEEIGKKPGLTYFIRAITKNSHQGLITRSTGTQSSGALRSMSLANSLIIVPEEKESLHNGEIVTIVFIH